MSLVEQVHNLIKYQIANYKIKFEIHNCQVSSNDSSHSLNKGPNQMVNINILLGLTMDMYYTRGITFTFKVLLNNTR